MSNLTLLPLVRVADGVQIGEDWSLAIAFYLDDGNTPILLTGLAFTLTVNTLATLTSASGQLTTSGASGNVLVISYPASATTLWPQGVFDISLTVTDGISTRGLFALSTLAVGAPQVARVSLIVAPDAIPQALASPIPTALVQAIQALQPASLAAALANIPSVQLGTLAQALFAALPPQIGATPPVSSGKAFVNASNYVVIAQ